MALRGEAWVEQIFTGYYQEPRAIATGGILRRSIYNVKAYASESALMSAVEKRGYHLLVVGDQYVIICNSGDFRVIC